MQYWIYILASTRNGTLYIGVTSDLIKRVFEHKSAAAPGFSKLHEVKNLVYYEAHDSIEQAIIREKQLKKWNRIWKLRLVEDFNPQWHDLYDQVCG